MNRIILCVLLVCFCVVVHAKPRNTFRNRRNNDAVLQGLSGLAGSLTTMAQQQQAEQNRLAQQQARRQAQLEAQQQAEQERQQKLRFQREQQEQAQKERQRQLEYERQLLNIKRQSQKAEDAEGIGGISFNRWQVYVAAAGVLVGVFALFKR